MCDRRISHNHHVLYHAAHNKITKFPLSAQSRIVTDDNSFNYCRLQAFQLPSLKHSSVKSMIVQSATGPQIRLFSTVEIYPSFRQERLAVENCGALFVAQSGYCAECDARAWTRRMKENASKASQIPQLLFRWSSAARRVTAGQVGAGFPPSL